MELLAAAAGQAADTKTSEVLDPDRLPLQSYADVIPAIGTCLGQNKEAVLFSDHVQCTAYRSGSAYLKKETDRTSTGIKLEDTCTLVSANTPPAEDAAPSAFDGRRLRPGAINDISQRYKTEIGSNGIRIFGASFCEKVVIVGLNIPFSLVLDNSFFKDGMEIRNLRTEGDLSVDGSLVFKQLRIIRSYVEGSLFGDKSFIENLSVSNSTINGSVSFGESVLFRSAQFDDVAIARELSVRASALSYFITQFSKIGGLLDLSHSEARCAYHINKSEIGFLVAKRAGFGTVEPPPIRSIDKRQYYAWRRDFTDAVKRFSSSPAVGKIISEPESCVNEYDRSYRAEFFIFDSAIKSSLCVNELQWLAPQDAGPYTSQEFFKPREKTDEYLRTVIALNGNTIGNNLIIDLWSKEQNSHDKIHDMVSERLHKFEAIGVKAGGLVIDFKDSSRKYFTAVDGLQFDRIYNAHATCEYGGSEKLVAPISEHRKLSIISDFDVQLELPTVEDVLKWLNLNEIGSTQPYTAFAAAFEKAGVDSTPITIARADRELCDRAAHWLLLPIIRPFCPEAVKRREGGTDQLIAQVVRTDHTPAATAQRTSGWEQLGAALGALPNALSDLAQLVFRAGLYFLADHGYRPAKVLWWVTITLVLFWAVFLLWLKVVAFAPKIKATSDQAPPEQQTRSGDQTNLRPIGFVFLLDRLLPHYRIIDANYDIDRYFKRISVLEAADRTPPAPIVRRLRTFEWPVAPVTDLAEIARIDNWLLALRLFGVVFTVFLAAAIGALFVR